MASAEGQYALIVGSGFKSFGDDAPGSIVHTSYGPPSAPVRALQYQERRVYLLPRHGEAVSIAPHAINYRANLEALRQLRVDRVIAVNTVGVINLAIHPGDVAVPDQIIDYTWGRAHSFHDASSGLEHVDFTTPFTERLRRQLLDAAVRAGLSVHDGGVYAATQGPRLETAAEVDRLERDGADFVGMTAMPEAVLARELGMEYGCLSLVVNYAAGRGRQPIHADLETATLTAKTKAMKLLSVFFGGIEA